MVKSHIIKSLCFDIKAADEAAAVEFAHTLKNIDCELLMNNVFKKYDFIEDTIRLDRVELDIGTIEPDQINNIGREISRQLEEVFAGVLKVRIRRIPPTTEEKRISGDISTLKIKSVEADIEVLIHYLKSGSLPWNIIASPDMEELLLNLLKAEATKLKIALVPELGSSIVRNRIPVVFSSSTIESLLTNLINDDHYRLIENFSAMVTEQISASGRINFEKELAASALYSVYSSVNQKQNFISVFISLLRPLLIIFPVLKLKTIHGNILDTIPRVTDDTQKYFYESIREILVQILKTKEITDEESDEGYLKLESRQNEEAESDKSAKVEIIQEDKTENKKKRLNDEPMENREEPSEETDNDQYYFIDNAGLVLLNWALLHRSFEQMGWIREEKIVDDLSRHKILIWMDYLVWGRRRIHEYGLLLNKILIGMHPADVADIHVSLTSKEKKAADELLKAVIEHWSVLKNTSIEGLRTAFLQRNGKLSNEEGGWQMHVESKGIDILIENLPWPYSIIKSSWMEKPLFTQWTTRV